MENEIKEKLHELKVQLNFVSCDKDISDKIKNVWEAFFKLEEIVDNFN
jgi:hypothetical protein